MKAQIIQTILSIIGLGFILVVCEYSSGQVPLASFHPVDEIPEDGALILLGREELVITDHNTHCPVTMKPRGRVLFFKAWCEGVYEDKDRWIVPPDCVVNFHVEGQKKGLYRAVFCPLEFKKYKAEVGI